jgi:hypothetical protein
MLLVLTEFLIYYYYYYYTNCLFVFYLYVLCWFLFTNAHIVIRLWAVKFTHR